ncbi:MULTISPECIES: DNA alkylation repair protein [unclassified Acidovorax]|uniref:DNA alkylation repair protein n=1 Tax=unclassified Acidovorax TaxID=2684926 RepID=UPI000C18457F|nr:MULTISPECIES: DNA alkylation repair protein [unclassified Acidovorax]PIF19563.1 3-methyladenine DNA glycosylase AlkC [Acidovorax sp. 59]PKW01409.1 3-methyladenine DNA glycosylase AlkC [Acidovorax sp. 30]
MAEPLKHLLNDTVPPRIAAMVRRAWRKFDTTAFLQQVEPGYESLELMARGQRIAQALQTHLPQDVSRALGVLVDSMDPPMGLDAVGEPDAGDRPYSAFLYLPHSIYIGTHGLPHFEAAMAAQHALTQRFTAEFCIRPYLLHHQGATLARLRDWAQDGNAHVRRLVSEGTRPRLPWAPRLPAFQNNPQLALPLLDALKDDPSSYVRRSVANHLGDIAKDHPDLAVGTARTWLLGAPAPREALVRHGLRFLIKLGDAAALDALGVGHAVALDVQAARVLPARARIGDKVRIEVELHNPTLQPQRVLADLKVHYVKAHGGAAPKVFKLQTLDIPPGATVAVGKTLSLQQMTTRTHYPGAHQVELVLNGRPQPLGQFQLS